MAPELITIPSSDAAFRSFVQLTLRKTQGGSREDLEARLRRTYRRAIVRERGLAGEVPSWYVYRDGAWRGPDHEWWWDDPAVPRVDVSIDGWIESLNPGAQGLLGIEPGSEEPRHFTDFVVPGAVEDAMTLFEIVRTTGALEATVVLQPTTGDAIAADVRVTASDRGMTGLLRLAQDVEAPASVAGPTLPESIEFLPSTDAAFRAYAERALTRMPEPTPEGLALRLRRLYPHAQVEATADGWVARRDRDGAGLGNGEWWLADDLPRVRYDAQALILEANDAATRFFGRPLRGHHWQEFVIAGSADEVALMLRILADAGAAESRFRMPRGDGSLLEFDSYTVVEGEEFSTVFRPAGEKVTAA